MVDDMEGELCINLHPYLYWTWSNWSTKSLTAAFVASWTPLPPVPDFSQLPPLLVIIKNLDCAQNYGGLQP